VRGETLGTQFLREKMGGRHLLSAGPIKGLFEPNGNSSQR
jgi:hypothetical protein